MAKPDAGGAKKIIDVTHADESVAEDSSKPIIVTNRPVIKDPMVTAPTAAELITKQTAAGKAPLKSKGVKIEPSSAPPLPEEYVAEEAEPKKETEEVKKPEPKPKPEPEPAKEPPAEEKPAPKETPPEEPEKAEKSEADKKITAEKAAEAEQAQQAEKVEKLVESRQYYLPINTVEKRRTKRFVVLGIVLSVLLALAWLDIALDAGLIHINNVQPLTHFFST